MTIGGEVLPTLYQVCLSPFNEIEHILTNNQSSENRSLLRAKHHLLRMSLKTQDSCLLDI